MTHSKHAGLKFLVVVVLAAATASRAADTWPIRDVPKEDAICFALYTVADGVLKMTAQLYPLADDVDRAVKLQVERDHGTAFLIEFGVSEEEAEHAQDAGGRR